MKLQCTKKLLDHMKAKPEALESEREDFSWHANILSMGRKKVLVIIHDPTQYLIAFTGMKAKEWKNLDQVVREGIAKVWGSEGIKAAVIDAYLGQLGELVITKTKDRNSVAKLNRALMDLEWYLSDDYESELTQVKLSKKFNQRLVGHGKNNYREPKKEMIRYLGKFSSGPVRETDAVILKIQLEVKESPIWRRVRIPLHLTFPDLHQVIQILFGWSDSHLHNFYLYGDLARWDDQLLGHPGFHPEGMMAVRCLVQAGLDFEDQKVIHEEETGKQLKHWITDKMLYIYDFGDNWRHMIKVEKIVDNPEEYGIVCLDGEGKTPPEDVGGESGYMEFLKVIENPMHLEYERYLKWSLGQGYRELDVETVNNKLKRKFS